LHWSIEFQLIGNATATTLLPDPDDNASNYFDNTQNKRGKRTEETRV